MKKQREMDRWIETIEYVEGTLQEKEITCDLEEYLKEKSRDCFKKLLRHFLRDIVVQSLQREDGEQQELLDAGISGLVIAAHQYKEEYDGGFYEFARKVINKNIAASKGEMIEESNLTTEDGEAELWFLLWQAYTILNTFVEQVSDYLLESTVIDWHKDLFADIFLVPFPESFQLLGKRHRVTGERARQVFKQQLKRIAKEFEIDQRTLKRLREEYLRIRSFLLMGEGDTRSPMKQNANTFSFEQLQLDVDKAVEIMEMYRKKKEQRNEVVPLLQVRKEKGLPPKGASSVYLCLVGVLSRLAAEHEWPERYITRNTLLVIIGQYYDVSKDQKMKRVRHLQDKELLYYVGKVGWDTIYKVKIKRKIAGISDEKEEIEEVIRSLNIKRELNNIRTYLKG